MYRNNVMRWLPIFIVAAFAALVSLSPMHVKGQVTQTGAGKPNPGGGGATFVGVGDVTGWTATTPYVSCAYVFKASQASTATNLCDLNDVSSGGAICTLRGTTSGKVDLSAYCPGSVTPMTACGNASGGVCGVSKMYDGATSGDPYVQATPSQYPILTFSAVNSLPCPTWNNMTTNVLLSTLMYNTTQPQTQFVVENHPTSASTAETIIGDGNIINYHPGSSTPNDIRAFWGTANEDSSPSGLTDGSWQAIQIVQDETNSSSGGICQWYLCKVQFWYWIGRRHRDIWQ